MMTENQELVTIPYEEYVKLKQIEKMYNKENSNFDEVTTGFAQSLVTICEDIKYLIAGYMFIIGIPSFLVFMVTSIVGKEVNSMLLLSLALPTIPLYLIGSLLPNSAESLLNTFKFFKRMRRRSVQYE